MLRKAIKYSRDKIWLYVSGKLIMSCGVETLTII